MATLLTGASGFIGSHLKKQIDCITVDKEHCDYNLDLANPQYVNVLPDNIDTVIHLAAFNSTKNFYSTPFDVIESIVLPTMNLLKRYPDAHFVYAGSSEEYAGTVNRGWANVPTPEDVVLSIEDITNPRWCYAAGKIAMESAVISHSVQHGNDYTILRYHNVYGPGQQNHFIPEFIERLKNNEAVLYGYEDTRSFCYIDDAIALTKLAIENRNNIFNIGSNHESRILDVAHTIMHLMDYDTTLLELNNGPAGSTPRRLPDITKILDLAGDFEFTSLDKGLSECITSLS